MKRSTEILLSCAMLLCYTAFCVWLFCLSKIQNNCQLMSINPFVPGAFLLCAYLLNSISARRGISLSLYVIIQLLLSALGIFLLLSTMELSPGGVGTRVLMSVVFACGVFASAILAMEPPKLNSLVTCFDVTVFAALVLLLLDRFLELPAAGSSMWSCFAAIAVTLAALIAGRVEREGAGASVRGNPAAGRALIVGLFALMGALAALLAAFASGGVRSLSEAALSAAKWCWGLVVAAAMLVLGLLERFLLWLSQFIGDEPFAAEPPVQGVSVPAGDMAMDEAFLPAWLGYAVLAVGTAALVWLLIRMRRERAGGRTVLRRRAPRGGEVRKSGLGAALRALFARLSGELGYRLNCLRLRRTPAGLLAWCERHAPKGAKRAGSESGSEFLRRMAALAPGEEQGAALETLSALVEQAFYSPRSAAVEPELYRAVRRCRFSVPEPGSEA